ncbi:MAG: hypothetical protein K0R71_43 [Bacillales bacterium]|jgi:uncharacterized protein|nr:hypothetical protein [Bacillales bacterium]
MKWTVLQIQRMGGHNFQIDETVDFSYLKEMDKQILDISPILVRGEVEFDSSKVVFHLTIQGTFVLPCSKTLVEVNYPVNIQTTETFFLHSLEDDEEGELVENGVIDLTPVVQELLLLEIPMQVYADSSDQESGTPFSGKGWEVVTEEEQAQKIDPRMAKLAELFKKDE